MEKVERGETEYKTETYLYQPVTLIDAPKIQSLIQLLHGILPDLSSLTNMS